MGQFERLDVEGLDVQGDLQAKLNHSVATGSIEDIRFLLQFGARVNERMLAVRQQYM